MTQLTKPPVRAPWAGTAAPTTGILDPDTQTAGYVSAGWPLSTTPPPRQFWNFILNYCMEGVRYLCQRGITDWDAAETYAPGAVVLAPNGIVYQCITANSNTTPASSPAFWGGLQGYALTGQLGGFVTQAELATDLSNYISYTVLADYGYVTNSAFDAYLSGYYTAAQINGLLNNLALTYDTSVDVNAKLSQYLSNASFNSIIVNYLTNAAAAAAYATNLYAQQLAGTAQNNAAAYTNTQLESYAPLSAFTGGGTPPNRWERSPTGVLHQWGVATGSANAPGATVTYPTSFTEIDSVVATAYGANATVTVLSQGLNSFQLINGISGQCTWHAYGMG